MHEATHTALGQLTLVATGYAGLVAIAALVVAVLRRPRPAWIDSCVWILELLMAVRVVAGIGTMLKGERPEELSAHVGYLCAAVAVLPIAMQSVEGDRGPWSSGVLAVAALAVTVVGVRLQMTWGAGG
jgi:hypothetical protein